MCEKRQWVSRLTNPYPSGRVEALKFKLRISLRNRCKSCFAHNHNSTIGNLQSLKKFWACENNLKSLPDTIGQLFSLQTLVLFSNLLESIPTSIVHLIRLEELSLISNPLSALPEAIGGLNSLITLELDRRLEHDPVLKKLQLRGLNVQLSDPSS